ncbi:MAG: XRE family transcriptional regulator [Rhizobiaceae bacterium]|nr:MAG: XRE family transcriptional regulator [Rhizobiaceae bacterium]
MEVAVKVGLNVQRLRRERGISQEELSFRTSCTRGYLSGIENGRRNPSLSVLAMIAKALDADIQELFAKPARGKAGPRPRRPEVAQR